MFIIIFSPPLAGLTYWPPVQDSQAGTLLVLMIVEDNTLPEWGIQASYFDCPAARVLIVAYLIAC